jgi:hypothetical protein
MNRVVNLVLLAVMLVGAAVTYDMKLQSELAAERVVQLENAVEEQKDAIQLLRAELSLLVQPGRLQAVVEHYADHFKLTDFELSQYAAVDEIPLKPADSADEEALAEIIEGSGRDIR